ncbi:hypothetical protein [Streptomyces sp. NPDC007172]|uniref:WXG100 family type VII secretion target n=1 Tax=Streptomyces sp. NPDC007172 TaxID=3364776 RepID=UPI0036D0957C
MTDGKPQASAPQAPPLTEKQRVSQQVSVTDMTTEASQALSGMLSFGGSPRFFGTTDFEGHQLNEMIDLVEHANPEHLTSAGDALFAAHEAIKEAAGALDKDIARVAWEGQAGDAFRDWGKNLANHARNLGDLASTAGVQISAAGTGLASVRQAMPPRDHRAEPVKATDLPAAKRVAGNAEYEAAVRVEKDRQEAINQMNRLSSFYTVSEQTLAAQQPPVFQPMPAVGVPPAKARIIEDPKQPLPGGASRHSPEGGSGVRHSKEDPVGPNHTRTETAGGPTATGTTAHPALLGDVASNKPVSTEINGVAPMPTPVRNQVVVTPTSPVTPAGPGPIVALPPGSGLSKPTVNGSGRSFQAGRGPGVTGHPGGTASATGRSVTGRGATKPVGPLGPSVSESISGRPSSEVGQSPMGRGVSGGTPRVGGNAPSRAGMAASAGGGRDGIVGGRPSAGAPGSTAPRTSKSTVVGAREVAGQAHPVSRPNQKGVVGAVEPSSGQARTGGRVRGNADGVVGVPQGRATGKRVKRGEFTTGGSGLARGARDQEGSDDEEEGDHTDPEDLAEDAGQGPAQPVGVHTTSDRPAQART